MNLSMKRIDSLDMAALDCYARLKEPQLFHYFEPAPGIFIAESPVVIERALDAGFRPLSFLTEEGQLPVLAELIRKRERQMPAMEDPVREGKSQMPAMEDPVREGKSQMPAMEDPVREGKSQMPVSEELAREQERQGEEEEKDADADMDGDADEIIPVYVSDMEVLAGITGYRLTRGMLCAMRRRPLPEAEEICRSADRILVLENVENPTNVGAIFRSAAALGMDAVLLTQGSSDPLYRRSIRVSMGTVFQIPWTFFKKETDWPGEGLALLHRHGFRTVAMALREDAAALDDADLNAEKKLAVIMGTEGDGLAERTIARCDYTVCIPMSHGADSLNVAAASAVACYQLGKRPNRPQHRISNGF